MMEIEKQIAEYQIRIRELYQRAMYREAIDEVIEAAAVAEDHYGEEHPVCASLYNNCALFHKCLGEYDEAIELYNRAMRIYKKVVGTTHKSTTTCMLNVGTVLKAQAAGKTGEAKMALLEAAREVVEDALAGKRETLGEDHFEVGNVLYVLGGVHNDLKNYAEAEKVLLQSLELLTKRFRTTEHPLVAAAQNNMGVVLKATGRFDEALDMYRQALDTRVKVLEPEHHPEILATKFNISELYAAMGDEDRANVWRAQILDHMADDTELQ